MMGRLNHDWGNFSIHFGLMRLLRKSIPSVILPLFSIFRGCTRSWRRFIRRL
jgi:hypothetical protein